MSRPLDPRLFRAVAPLRRLLLALAALQVIGAVLLVVQAGLLADVIVSVFGREFGRPLLAPLVGLGAVGIARAGLAAVQEWHLATTSVLVRARLRRAVLDAVVRLGPAWADRQPPGRLVTAAGPGLEALDGYVTRSIPALVAAAVVPAVVLVRIGTVDWLSVLLLIAALPLVPAFMILVGKTTKRRMDRQYTALARLSGHFLDLVQGLATLKIYGRAAHQVRLVEEATDAYRRRTMSMLRMAFLSGLVLDLVATLSVAVVAVDVGLRLDHARIGLGPALLVLLLAPEVFAPLRAMGAQHHANEQGRAAAEAALDVIDEAPPADGTDDGGALRRVRGSTADGSVTFASVGLSYPGRPAALSGFDLVIAPGEVIALRGRSGAGKSTALACLLGFRTADHGRVEVGTSDGVRSVADLDLVSWREQLAWVPQRPCPTQATVGQEIALGDPQATAEQLSDVIACCEAPEAATALGEDGRHVSAGQRRRIAAARALLRARRQITAGVTPLVLLDEPSEDLDEGTERVIAAVISGLAGQATVLMATHSERLAAVADRVVTLDSGRVSGITAHDVVRTRTEPPRTPLQAGRPAPAATPSRRVIGPILAPSRVMRQLWGAALLSGAAGVAGLALTATSIWLICRAAEHPNVQALEIAVVGVRGFALSKALLRYAERLVSHDYALRLLSEIRARIFAALGPLVPAGVGDLRRGDLLRRFIADIDCVQEGLVRAVVPFAGAGITCVAAVVLAGLLAPVAGLVLAAGLAVGVGLAPWLSARLAGNAAQQSRLAGRRDAMAASLLDGLPELAAYGADRDAVAAITETDTLLGHATRRPAAAAALGVGLSGAAAAVTLPAVLACASVAVRSHSLAAISVAALVACVLAGFDATAQLSSAFAAWSRLRASLARITEILSAAPPVDEPEHASGITVGATGLSVAALSIGACRTAPAVLENVTLRVGAGQRVVVMGPSGCGKSTLLAAALRLVPEREGHVDITRGSEALPLADLAAEQVPPLVAGSLQGDHVFNASLRDNLRVVRPDATDADLDAVAARVGLSSFLASLPEGWNCAAGPDGAALSGGQRQRLLLARALLADPEVLVLDEPTAHLDAETESEVLADLLSATTGRTVLMSTHRRLPLRQFDQLVRIEDRALVGL